MVNKKLNQTLKIALTSLIAALACTGIIYAATTVGTNISTGGTLDVTGTATFDTNTLYVDATNNRVGIGTSSPYAKLSVVGEAVASYFTATSTTATSTIVGGLNVGSGGLVYDFSSGNIGIGTTSPNVKLEIDGDVTIGGGTDDNSLFILEVQKNKTDTQREYRAGQFHLLDSSTEWFGRGVHVKAEHTGNSSGNMNIKGLGVEVDYEGQGAGEALMWAGMFENRFDGAGNYSNLTNVIGVESYLLMRAQNVGNDHTITGNYFGFYANYDDFDTEANAQLNVNGKIVGFYASTTPDFDGTQATVASVWLEPQTNGDTNNYGLVIDGDCSGVSSSTLGCAIILGDTQTTRIYENGTSLQVRNTNTNATIDFAGGDNSGQLRQLLTVHGTNKSVDILGYDAFTDVESLDNGTLRLGQTAGYQGLITYDGGTTGVMYIANTYNNDAGDIEFRTKTDGTDITAMIINGSGEVDFGKGMVPDKVTADPCGSGYPEGSIFYNDTANVLCYCNGADDLKVADDLACF